MNVAKIIRDATKDWSARQWRQWLKLCKKIEKKK